jgi:hypothetical protein
MSDSPWSQATLWDGAIEPPTALFLVTFWDEGTATPPLPAGERTIRVWAQTRAGAVAIVQRYFQERGRDFRTVGMQLLSLLHVLEPWVWEPVGFLG